MLDDADGNAINQEHHIGPVALRAAGFSFHSQVTWKTFSVGASSGETAAVGARPSGPFGQSFKSKGEPHELPKERMLGAPK